MDPDGTNAAMSWAEEQQGKMGGTLWDYRERHIENSPIFYLDRIETPLLLVHGSADTRVQSHLSDELFMFLRRLGKEVEYAKYPDEPHAVLGRANSIGYANRMIAWFDRHLRAERRPAVAQSGRRGS